MDSQQNRPIQPFTSRFYETEADLLQMQELLIEGRNNTDDWRYPHFGEMMFGFFMIARHLDPREHIRLWYAGDRLAGYAMLGEDPSFDFQVLPEYEWRGIETEAVEWAEARTAELRQQDPQRWSAPIVSGARQDNQLRKAFLEQNGFRPGGQFSEVNMLRSLDEPLPEVMIPDGCQVRSITGASEVTNRAGAQREVWEPWSVGNVTDDDYLHLMGLPGYERDLDVVAVAPDGVMAAYVNGWVDTRNKIGDQGPVGARPAYRRQGLARAALVECMRRMRTLGMDRVCISTGVLNTPAIRLYESIGFRIENRYLEFIKDR